MYNIKCTCHNEYQDKVYGKDIRVHNKTAKKPSPDTVIVRCTVCGATQKVNGK